MEIPEIGIRQINVPEVYIPEIYRPDPVIACNNKFRNRCCRLYISA